MDSSIQYSVNIAMEGTMIFVLLVLIITCFLQRKIFFTTIPIIFFSGFIILSLIVQIVAWSFALLDFHIIYGLFPFRIVYILEYCFSYAVSVVLYYYVEALIRDGYSRSKGTYTPKKHVHRILIGWGVASAVIYAICLFDPSIYRLENGVAVYNTTAYVLMHIVSKLSCMCAIALIIRHRNVIGKQEAALSIIIILLASVFFVVDEVCGLCISYVLLSLFVFIIYVRVDLRKGILLERQEREIAEWKTQIMLSQMQPHFLYNVLATISSMCEMQNAFQARDVVNRFADYFRVNLEALGKEKIIPFEKELEHIKTYLWLEKIRFEDDLNICYDIETTGFAVPSLVIQPMVENAVKHGIREKEDPGTVTIRTRETPEDYLITVEDDGVGFDTDEYIDTHIHVGIDNVRKRLEIICNGSCEISSEKGKGTVVTIHIPKVDSTETPV